MRTIEPAATSVTALLARCRSGPANEPVAVRNLADFDDVFRGARGSRLRRAVRDFFANGGTEALAVRVANQAASIQALRAHDWQLLVVVDRAVDLAAAESLCRDQLAFLVCDAESDGGMPAVLAENAAVYHPRLAGPHRMWAVAPSVAGVFARTDALRGVWKAPAGVDAAVAGTLSRDLSESELTLLNSNHVNALRSVPGRGTVVWGARTAATDSEWKYVPVRRTMLFLRRSIGRGLEWTAPEVNDEPLWADVRLAVGSFLHQLWTQSAFQGQTPSVAYQVACDQTTTTEADIAAGRLGLWVAFAPLKPAEFVTVRIEARAAKPS